MEPPTLHLERPDGRLGYDVSGTGPLVLLVPGLGDLRATYRLLAPRLTAAGYRVATVDLRGHGDSDASFPAYGDEPTATDIAAIIDALGGPAVVVGNSMAAAAGVLVAAAQPELVRGLVLIGPFVRVPRVGAATRLMTRLAMTPAWAATAWNAYLPKLYAGARPADFDAYRRRIVSALRRPGYARAFVKTARTTHAAAERALGEVRAPVLVVMGDRDPDFPDPRHEAAWIAEQLHGRVAVIGDAGHYPQSQQPDAVAAAIIGFLDEVAADA
jgi:pimeloyl-ACP methyl ester carboxylesterase